MGSEGGGDQQAGEQANLQPEPPAGQPAANPAFQRLMSWKKSAIQVADTLLNISPAAEHSQSRTNVPSGAQKASGWKKLAEKVATTILDVDAVRNVADKFIGGKDKDVRELVRSAPGELGPMREQVRYEMAAPCGQRWRNLPEETRLSFCEQCHLQVYDFDGMTHLEAEQLVLQREERTGVAFFKRKDGKFLTNNCPVGIKAARTRKIILIGVSAGAILLLVLSAVIRPAEPPPSEHPARAERPYIPYNTQAVQANGQGTGQATAQKGVGAQQAPSVPFHSTGIVTARPTYDIPQPTFTSANSAHFRLSQFRKR